MQGELKNIIRQMDDIRSGNPWLGFSFKTLLAKSSGINPFASPGDVLFSPAQLLAHLTFWNAQISERLTTGIGKPADNHPDNWPENTQLSDQGWAQLQQQFDQAWIELRFFLNQQEDSFLDQTYSDPDFEQEFTFRFLLEGMVQHEIYHLGQLGIAFKLLRAKH